MSDVSGIPYMGPMGQGNFFAPQFSYNPQINPTAGYAAPAAYAQNEFSNLTNNLRASEQYTANLITSAAMAMPNSPQGQWMFSDTGGPASRGGGSVFDQGAINNFATSGGGFSFPSIPDYTSGRGGGPSVDWTTLFKSPSTNYDTFQGGYDNIKNDPYSGGMAMPGGLGSPASASSGAQPFNWSQLWGGEGAAQAAVPSSGDRPYEPPAPAMPSSKNLLGYEPGASLAAPGKSQDQPAFDFTGGNAGWGNAPGATPDSKALLGYEPQNVPAQTAETGSRVADPFSIFDPKAVRDFGLSGGGRAYEYVQQPGETAGRAPVKAEGGYDADKPASALAEEARSRLAAIIGSPQTEKAVEEAAKEQGGTAIPLPRERPEGADVPRPPADIPDEGEYPSKAGGWPIPRVPKEGAPDTERPGWKELNPPRPSANVPFTVEKGKEARIAGVKQQLSAAVQGAATLLPPGYTVEAYSGVRNRPGDSRTSQHYSGNAMDVRIIGPDGPIPSQGADTTGMYTLLARGVKTWLAQNDPETAKLMRWGGAFETTGGSGVPDLMHFDLASRVGYGNLRPESRFSTLQPLTEAERNAMPANIPLLGDNQVPLDAAAPRGTGSAYNAVPRFFGDDYAIANRSVPPDELKANYDKYIYHPSDRPTMARDESLGPDPNPFKDFRPSENVIDRRETPLTALERKTIPPAGWVETAAERAATPTGGVLGEMLGTQQIAKLEANAAARWMAQQGAIAPDRTPPGGLPQPSRAQLAQYVDTPDSSFEDLWGDRAQLARSMADFQSPTTDYESFQQPASPNRVSRDFGGFSRSPEPSQRAAPGGVGPEMEPPTPEFMQTVAQTESGFDPDKHNPRSQYKGMYQLNEPEFRKYGGTGSIYDQDQNSMAAMKKMTAEGQTAQNVLGRALTPVEQYMVHQQGLYGTLAHLQNPDQPAWKSFQQVAKWSDEKAKTAIWDNLTKDMKAQFGKVENITSRDFIDMWTTKMLQKQVESGQPGGSILP